MLAENKAIARVWFEEVMNRHDLSAIDRTYAADYVHRSPDGNEIRGRGELRRAASKLIEAVPDRIASVEMQLAEGDCVVTRWESRGTNTGPLFGRPPTGESVIAHGIVISRIENGMIAEDWEMIHIEHQAPS